MTQALGAGLAMATTGDAYMAGAPVGARYNKWFGATEAGRAATIKAHFVALKDAFANKPATVDCGCKKTYYAYVYPTKPYVIYVCRAFWNAPITGTDSKGGTLVHEMRRFNVVASTDDWVYGQAGAASLAISDPSRQQVEGGVGDDGGDTPGVRSAGPDPSPSAFIYRRGRTSPNPVRPA